MKKAELTTETPADAKPVLAVRACEGSCEIHKGEVIPVIIEGHGWDGAKFNYGKNYWQEVKSAMSDVQPYR